MQEKFLKWMLGVSRSTPGYMVKEELQRKMLRRRTEIRAWGYERKLEKGKGDELARRCWEIKGKARRGKALKEWKEERRAFYEGRGWRIEWRE